MEEHHSVLMLRQAAEPTTRRSALATLFGSALALNEPDTNEAAKKAKRGKARRRARRKRQRNQNGPLLLKPIKLSIVNQGPNPITVEYGEFYPLKCCHSLGTRTFDPGVSEAMATNSFSMFVWINDKIWLDVLNLPLAPPFVSVAVGGQTPPHNHLDTFLGPWGDWCCRTIGDEIARDVRLMEGRYVEFAIEGKYFVLFRDNDTNYKMYRLLLPYGL